MASRRTITSFLASRSIASAPRAASRAPSLRTISPATAARRQPWTTSHANPTLPPVRLLSSSSSSSSTTTAHSNPPPTNPTPETPPPFKQWTFNDITSILTTATPTTTPTILIDVREPPELRSTGIIPTALSIPLNSQPDALFLTDDEFLTRFGFPKPGLSQTTAPTTTTTTTTANANANANADNAAAAHTTKPQLVFYCRAGVRAKTAAELAVQAGYERERIGVYDGSWLDWEKRGGRVERWEGNGNGNGEVGR
ncbi:Thiosulfate sulfurtransferase rdl2, mitochondrial [Emydomyces testavorans]|uniref:Thiosulfate sulfurtransferase rdl2, mitochondrial n=1 Tax=Emydomyces testavorans TaxID=2070801 RepID=A0AAF0DIT2_9EURO|nr:Thiosulfate sulfurtransferase rdl2, mitochondrial [Emydomyces testavorans]